MLRGTLEEFSLPDLVRLISETAKSGVLELSGPTGGGQLTFADGRVCGSRSAVAREPLGRKLVRAHAVTENQLWRALGDQSKTNVRIGQLLIASGVVTPDQVEGAVREQIEDGLVDILRLYPTTFVWRSEAIEDEGATVIPTESFLSSVAIRLKEIETIRQRIPSDETLVSLNPSPPDHLPDIHLGRDEWRMLSLLGARRAVRDLMQYSGAGDMQTLRSLDRLLAAGLIEIGTPAPRKRASRHLRPPRPPGVPPPPPKASDPIEVRREQPKVIRLNGDRDVSTSPEVFKIAFVSTSNRPQGFLAAALLRRQSSGLGVEVVSLRLDDLVPVAPWSEADLAARRLGLDMSDPHTRQLRRGELKTMDLVIGLDWWHVDRAVLYGAAPREKSFTLSELLSFVDKDLGLGDPRPASSAHARRIVKLAHNERIEGTSAQIEQTYNEPGPESFERLQDICERIVTSLFAPEAIPKTD
jgi:protein-tyrosine-phosphatase